jgi:ADP-ribose pyrophosphatase
MVDVEDTAIETVQREAVEEAGIDVTGAELFGPFDTMPSPGASTEIVHHYIALVDLKKVVNGAVFGLEAEGERTITFARDRKAVMADLERGALLHGPLATSLLWLELLILKGHIKL